MDEIEKLDKVLNFVLLCEAPPKRTAVEIQSELTFELTTKETIEILDKLTKDGYVIRELQNWIAFYFSSFEGRLFVKKGGYAENERITAKIESRKEFRDLMLLVGTWAVAVGALALVAWEMVKTFYIEKHCP